MVILFVTAMNSDFLGSSYGSQNQTHFLNVGNFDVFGSNRFLIKFARFVLAWNFDVVFLLVELVAIKLVEPLRIFTYDLMPLKKTILINFLVDVLHLSYKRGQIHLVDF